jgi:hypothetical protein
MINDLRVHVSGVGLESLLKTLAINMIASKKFIGLEPNSLNNDVPIGLPSIIKVDSKSTVPTTTIALRDRSETCSAALAA